MVVGYEITHLIDHILVRPQPLQYVPGDGRAFALLVIPSGAIVLLLRLMDPDIMEVRGGDDHGWIVQARVQFNR